MLKTQTYMTHEVQYPGQRQPGPCPCRPLFLFPIEGPVKNEVGAKQFSAIVSAMSESEQSNIVYKVVVNHEEQYSIWPVDRENPLGWSNVGKQGLKQECLEYINKVWTDMRPLSLRKRLDTPQDT
jgi:MbtH protein